MAELDFDVETTIDPNPTPGHARLVDGRVFFIEGAIADPKPNGEVSGADWKTAKTFYARQLLARSGLDFVWGGLTRMTREEVLSGPKVVIPKGATHR